MPVLKLSVIFSVKMLLKNQKPYNFHSVKINWQPSDVEKCHFWLNWQWQMPAGKLATLKWTAKRTWELITAWRRCVIRQFALQSGLPKQRTCSAPLLSPAVPPCWQPMCRIQRSKQWTDTSRHYRRRAFCVVWRRQMNGPHIVQLRPAACSL